MARNYAFIPGFGAIEETGTFQAQIPGGPYVNETITSGGISGTSALSFGAGATDLNGTGTLAGSSTPTFGAGATDLNGTGALAGSSPVAFTDTGTLGGTGTLAGTSSPTFTNTATLLGTGALAGTSLPTFTNTATLGTPPAEAEQEGFRWRADDGSESTANWRQTQDVDDTATVGDRRRLRVIINASSGDPVAATYQLEYRRSTVSTWNKVK